MERTRRNEGVRLEVRRLLMVKYAGLEYNSSPLLEEKYIVSMTANDKLLPYLKDNGEGRRLGTLAVFIDDGIDNNEPIVAIPLNLSILDLPQSMTYLGFTALTGLKWENHDILEWHWCDSADCNNDKDELQGLGRQ